MNTIVQTLSQKRQLISGKIIIGIDPAKDKPKKFIRNELYAIGHLLVISVWGVRDNERSTIF